MIWAGKGTGARGGPGHLIGGAHLTAHDARRIPCPLCGVKAVAKCVNQDGTRTSRTHPERVAAFKEQRS